jgi:hypothetical protein
MRLAVALATVVLAAALAAGCGDSSVEPGESRTGTVTSVEPGPIGASARSCGAQAADVEGLRATGIPCELARRAMYGWQRETSCALATGASRGSCQIRSYRCQAVRAGRGLAVSCARPGQSVAFLAKR